MRSPGITLAAIVALAAVAAAQEPWQKEFDHAQALARDGRLQAALEAWNGLVSSHPDNKDLYYQRACVRGSLRDYRGALADCNRALALDADNCDAWFVRGQAHRDLQEFDDAVADFGRVIELRPRWAPAYAFRGQAEAQFGDLEAGYRDARRGTQLQGDSMMAWYVRGQIELDLGKNLRAWQSLTTALLHAAPQQRSELWRLRAEVAWRDGDREAAFADLRSCIDAAEEPEHKARRQMQLGCLLLAADRQMEAAPLFAAARQSPAMAPWGTLMDWCVTVRRDPGKAAEQLESAFDPTGQEDEQLLRDLRDVCLHGASADQEKAFAARTVYDQCPLWFFAGWHAESKGQRADARRYFLRCINTGRADYKQWPLALAVLQQWSDGRAFAIEFGIEVAAVTEGDSPRLEILSVRQQSAADIQGLAVGDRVVTIGGHAATVELWQQFVERQFLAAPVRLCVRHGDVEKTDWYAVGVRVDAPPPPH